MNNLAEKQEYENYNSNQTHQLGKLSFDPNLHTISSNKNKIYLRHQINQLLLFLSQNSNKAVSREELINAIWNGNNHTGQKALTHTVCKLRQILETLSTGEISILTIPKFGYCLSRNISIN